MEVAVNNLESSPVIHSAGGNIFKPLQKIFKLSPRSLLRLRFGERMQLQVASASNAFSLFFGVRFKLRPSLFKLWPSLFKLHLHQVRSCSTSVYDVVKLKFVDTLCQMSQLSERWGHSQDVFPLQMLLQHAASLSQHRITGTRGNDKYDPPSQCSRGISNLPVRCAVTPPHSIQTLALPADGQISGHLLHQEDTKRRC